MFTILKDAIILEFEGKTYTILGFREMEILKTISIIEESERSHQMKRHLDYIFKQALEPFIDLLRDIKFSISNNLNQYTLEFVKTLFSENGMEVGEYQTI